MHERAVFDIDFIMDELNYLMVDQKRKENSGRPRFRERVRVERFLWHNGVAALHLVPPGWIGGHRLIDYADKLMHSQAGLWIAPELEKCFPGYRAPCPEPELAAFLLAEQPFREILVLVAETSDYPHRDLEWWQQRFLEACFDRLNGLYLVKGRTTETERAFYDWLYEQSGLPVCVTDELPVTEGKKTVVVDINPVLRLPARRLMQSSLYLDLTSDPEKQRIIKQKRTDISYISARNYLDTAFKARYNAI